MHWAAALVLLASACGCSTRDPFTNPFEDPKPGWATIPDHPFAPHGLPMFDGKRGTVLTWFDVSQAIDWADVIIIGESHDDATAHRVQLAIVEETLARFPRTAVSLEMLERDEQPALDEFLRGEIDADAFIDRTGSRHWAGKDSWVDFYQPIIDAAKLRGAPVVAANAPRRHVRQARLEGYPALTALPANERATFDLPRRPRKPGYRARFDSVMGAGHDDDATEVAAIDATFRSQLVWDATMAESILRARKLAAKRKGELFARPRVVHLVGQFHSDYEGGLVSEISARNPFLRICVISIQRRDGETLDSDDYGRAAIVMYSGARPPKEPVVEAAPAPAPPVESAPAPIAPAAPDTPDAPIAPAFPDAPPSNFPWPTAPPGPSRDPAPSSPPGPTTPPEPTAAHAPISLLSSSRVCATL